MRSPRLAAVAVSAACALAGCGGNDGEPIPADDAATLETLLDQAQRRVNAPRCGILESETFPNLERAVEDLPSGVDSDLRNALEDGVNELRQLAIEECQENRAQQQDDTQTDTTEPEGPVITLPRPRVDPTPTQPEEEPPADDQPDGRTPVPPDENPPDQLPRGGTGGAQPPGQGDGAGDGDGQGD